MYVHDLSEESYKNGFTDGYIRGVLDQTAEAMSGSIEWHKGIPKEDQDYCYICQPIGDERYVIRPAKYVRKYGVYYVDDFEADGSYVQRRLPQSEIYWWAHIKDPFSMRLTFTVPEAKP